MKLTVRHCITCDHIFHTRRIDSICCSRKCLIKYWNKKSYSEKRAKGICPSCNNPKSDCRVYCVTCLSRWHTPEQERRRRLKRLYNITPEDYEDILTSQNGGCAICNKPYQNTRYGCLPVDHDHETGKIRGLLCDNCNGHLGWYEQHKENIGKYLGDK